MRYGLYPGRRACGGADNKGSDGGGGAAIVVVVVDDVARVVGAGPAFFPVMMSKVSAQNTEKNKGTERNARYDDDWEVHFHV